MVKVDEGRDSFDGDTVGIVEWLFVDWYLPGDSLGGVPPQKFAGVGVITMNVTHAKFCGLVKGPKWDRFNVHGN